MWRDYKSMTLLSSWSILFLFNQWSWIYFYLWRVCLRSFFPPQKRQIRWLIACVWSLDSCSPCSGQFHGYMPAQLRNCTLVPICKGSKDPVISDIIMRFSGICPYSEQSIRMVHSSLLAYQDHFQTSGLQFGFKQKMLTSLCTGCVKSIVSHYMTAHLFFPASWCIKSFWPGES